MRRFMPAGSQGCSLTRSGGRCFLKGWAIGPPPARFDDVAVLQVRSRALFDDGLTARLSARWRLRRLWDQPFQVGRQIEIYRLGKATSSLHVPVSVERPEGLAQTLFSAEGFETSGRQTCVALKRHLWLEHRDRCLACEDAHAVHTNGDCSVVSRGLR